MEVSGDGGGVATCPDPTSGSDVTIGQCIVSSTVQFSTTQDTVMKQALTLPSDSVLCLELYSSQRHKTLS